MSELEALQKQARQRDLATIHIAAKQLGMDRETYEAMLQTASGRNVNSSSALSDAALKKVIKHLKASGWKPQKSRPQRDPQARKILALWIDMSKTGIVRDASDKALNAFVKRTAGKDRLEWLNTDEANSVIEALKAMRDRD